MNNVVGFSSTAIIMFSGIYFLVGYSFWTSLLLAIFLGISVLIAAKILNKSNP